MYLLVLFLTALSHDCTFSLFATPSPSLTLYTKSNHALVCQAVWQFISWKAFLKDAISSKRPRNHPLLPISLLSIVIWPASIHTSVYSLFNPSSTLSSITPTSAQWGGQQQNSCACNRVQGQVHKCSDIHYWAVKSLHLQHLCGKNLKKAFLLTLY